MEVAGQYKRTKTTKFMIQLNKFLFICGLPNYWVEDLNFSQSFCKIYQRINSVGNIFIGILLISELGAFFTQNNLTEKQATDLFLFSISHSIVTFFRIRMAQQEPEIRDVFYKLGIGLKAIYNDLEVEKVMVKKSKFFSIALVINCGISVLFMLLEACMRTIRTGDTFNAIITVIPDINDNSTTSNIIRVIYHLLWLIHLTRIFSVYTLVICLITAMSYQFKNLNSYFWSLNEIFAEDRGRTHKLREEAYELAIKTGIKMHADSLNCTQQIQTICREVFSGQIIFNTSLLILLMFQMVNSDRNLTNALAIVMAAASILFSTGLFMWNAGDITVEAEKIPNNMFCSGWENCYTDSSKRVRKLLIISMMRAQQPVILTGFGIIPLSYQSYVSIVKSSYSVFSVVY